jgi:hypothetical protein
MPRRSHGRRHHDAQTLLASAPTCAATVVPWTAGPPGCPPDAVMFVLMSCTAPCPTCDAARPRIWRPAAPAPSAVSASTAVRPGHGPP